eukprot:s531_g9.t1
MDAPSPEREPEILPRPRGIRAGKSAVRKRKAYHAHQLALQPYRYSSIEEVPVVHQDGSSRPLYTGPGWKPDFDNEEQLEEVIIEAELLHQASMNEVESQVRDVLNEADAANFRTWKNGFKVQLSKLDTSGRGLTLAWISRAVDADKADLQDSGLLPRLDAWVAGELSSGRVLKQSSELEQDITAYIERCGQLGQLPEGAVMLSIISRHYDLDRVRGSVLTASTLFQIELGGSSIKDLRDFVNRIRLVLSAIPIGQRPDDRLTGEWLFHRVKHIRKLEHGIEDIRESGSTSYRREWPYLWEKIQDVKIPMPSPR